MQVDHARYANALIQVGSRLSGADRRKLKAELRCSREGNTREQNTRLRRSLEVTLPQLMDQLYSLRKRHEGGTLCSINTYWLHLVADAGYPKCLSCGTRALACLNLKNTEVRMTLPAYCSAECKTEGRMVRRVSTCRAVYGYDSANAHPAVVAKMLRSNRRNHGGVHSTGSDEVRQKRQNTNMKRYGVPEVALRPGWSQKAQKEQIAKQGCLTVQLPHVTEKRERTYAKRTGFRNPSQNPAVVIQKLEAGWKRKEFTTQDGRVLSLQGYEPQVARALERVGLKVWSATEKGIAIPYGVGRVYLPDLAALGTAGRYLVEVKSTFTVRAPGVLTKYRAAVKECEKRGWEYRLVVWDPKREKRRTFCGKGGVPTLRSYLV